MGLDLKTKGIITFVVASVVMFVTFLLIFSVYTKLGTAESVLEKAWIPMTMMSLLFGGLATGTVVYRDLYNKQLPLSQTNNNKGPTPDIADDVGSNNGV